MASEQHTIPTWLEREGNPEPNWVIKQMKRYGIYKRGKMTYTRYSMIYDAFIELIMTHGTNQKKETVND